MIQLTRLGLRFCFNNHLAVSDHCPVENRERDIDFRLGHPRCASEHKGLWTGMRTLGDHLVPGDNQHGLAKVSHSVLLLSSSAIASCVVVAKLGFLTPSRSLNTLVIAFLRGQGRAWELGVCTAMTHRSYHSPSLSLNTCCPSRTALRG